MAWDAAGWKTKLVDLEKETLKLERIIAKSEIDNAVSISAGILESQDY